MSRWTESEFQRVAMGTKLSGRTLAACSSVLVDGMSGIDAAAQHKMTTPQISRGIGVLRDQREQIVTDAKVLRLDDVILKYAAEKAAKNLLGPGLAIGDALPGKAYEGPMIVNTPGFMVQKVGRGGVMHDLGKFEQMPVINIPLVIAYPKDGGKAVVTLVGLANEQVRDISR
jgi:hypothetical protein